MQAKIAPRNVEAVIEETWRLAAGKYNLDGEKVKTWENEQWSGAPVDGCTTKRCRAEGWEWMAEETPEWQNIQIEVPPEIESGVYANWAIVHHTQHEVTIDFCQLGITPAEPGEAPTARVVSRVHIPPTFVMALLQAISTNVARREDTLRQIEEGGEQHEP